MANLKEAMLIAYESVQNEFVGPVDTEELKASVNELLLNNQSCDYNITGVQGMPEKFKFTLQANIRSAEELGGFIQKYELNNGETLRESKQRKLTDRSQYCVDKYYRCQHNTRVLSTKDVEKVLKNDPSKRLKNTNCPFTMAVRIEKDPSVSRPCKVKVEWSHTAIRSSHYKLQVLKTYQKMQQS